MTEDQGTPIPTMNPKPQAKPVVEMPVERPNSVEISINAKGMWSGKVKVYANTINDAMIVALLKGVELSVVIRKQNGG